MKKIAREITLTIGLDADGRVIGVLNPELADTDLELVLKALALRILNIPPQEPAEININMVTTYHVN